MEIRLAADLQSDSIVDGPGIRIVLWTQGCPHNCFGCHNPTTHDFEDGGLVDIEELKQQISKIPFQDGITFSGGDPMCQPEACAFIAKYCQSIGLNVWCYTGYTFEELLKMSKRKPSIYEFLKQIDILVDGRFIMSQKSLDLKFRGSKNQRIIDVQKSLQKHEVVISSKYQEESKQIGLFGMSKEEYMFV